MVSESFPKSINIFYSKDQLQSIGVDFIFLVKVHKNVMPPPLRPICSQLRTVTYFASKFVSMMLLPLVKEYIPTYFDDPLFVIEFLRVNRFSDSIVIMAADIENLYPSIDINDCLIKVDLFIKSCQSRSLNCDLIMSLLSFILKNNFFEIDGLFFHQISGVAMGTPCAVMVSVIYIHMLESVALSTMDVSCRPLYLVRFIDDYFGLFNTIADTKLFLERFNCQHSTIRIPEVAIQISSSVDNIGINFLDFTVFQALGDPYLRVKLFSKPFYLSHHTYLHFRSKHPLHMKTAFIKSELNRIFLRSSSRLDCLMAFSIFYNNLIGRGYPISLLDGLFLQHVVYSSTLQEDYIGKRLHYITCRLILKFHTRKTSVPLLYKRKAGSYLPFNRILATDSITHAPSFASIFRNRNPFIVTYGHKKLGSFL